MDIISFDFWEMCGRIKIMFDNYMAKDKIIVKAIRRKM